MAALRAWSAPGRRDDLIAAAWRAGEHSVVALQRAAGVASRQTIYTALAGRGINPDTDRTEPPTMTTLTVGPYSSATSTDDLEKQYERAVGALMAEARDQVRDVEQGSPDAEAHTRRFSLAIAQTIGQHTAVKYHAELAPRAHQLAVTRELAAQALHLVETTYAALRTARYWLAAHHTYIEAVFAARAAVGAWREAVIAYDEHADRNRPFRSSYEEHVAEADRLPDHASLADVDAAVRDLEARYSYRQKITAETRAVADLDRREHASAADSDESDS